MKLDIQSRDMKLTHSMTNYVKNRVTSLFGSRYNQIQRITIQLSNESKEGRSNKRCKVKVTLPRMKEIVIDDVQTDPYAAVFSAIDRACRTVNRRLKRLQLKKRQLYVPSKPEPEIMMNGRYVYS